jgi:PRTRC genetic system protein E
MNFFKTLAQTGIKDVLFQVKQDENGILTVFITPKTIAQDSALKELKPIFVSGTAEDMDAEFFTTLAPILEQTQKLFSNVEAYEVQMAEVTKATAEVKKAKEKATADAKKATTVLTEDGEVVPATPTGKPIKEVVINNEKVLKEFMASIKGENILLHKDKIEELYALCTEAELDKPFPKKVRIDLDIAIRKKKNLDDVKLKFGFTKSEEVVVETETAEIVIPEEAQPIVTEEVIEEEIATQEPALTTKESFKQRNDVPEVIQEIANASPNEIPTMVPGAVEEQSVEEIEVVDEEEFEEDVEIAILAAPPVIEEILELVMISTDGTKEDYMKAGWSEEQLIQHGKAHWVKVQKTIAPPPTSLKYEFPKPFNGE